MCCDPTDFWPVTGDIALFLQSEIDDVTTKSVRGDYGPSGGSSEYRHNPMVPVTCSLQQQDLMTKAITEVLRSTHVYNLIVCAIHEMLDNQEEGVIGMITKALQLVWYAQHSTEAVETMEPSVVKGIMTSVIRNEAPFRWIDNVVIYGVNDMLPSGQLNNFMMDIIKELLASGELDGSIQDGVRNVLLSKHEDEGEMVAISLSVPSRQLDDILLDIFAGLLSSGELDDILVSAVSDVLKSGKWDSTISNTFALLQNEVTLIKCMDR